MRMMVSDTVDFKSDDTYHSSDVMNNITNDT